MDNKNLKIKQTLTLAYENHIKNNLDLAESLYNKILKIDPNHIDSIFLLGTLYLQKKNLDKAMKLFEEVIKVKPNHANALHNLAYALIEIGKPRDAKKLFNKVIEIQPNHLDAHYNLGNVHKHLGEFYEAKNYYDKAIKIKPNNAKVYNNLGNVLKELGKFEEAISSYNKAIKIQYNHANAYHNLGSTYKQLGDFKKAKEFYKKSHNYQPGNLETLFVLSDFDKDVLNLDLKKRIKKVISDENISKKNKAYGNFLLAKYELEDNNFEGEFKYLLKGHSHYFDFKKKPFDQGLNYWLKEIPQNQELMNLGTSVKNIKQNKSTIKPIFIVGVPRCGSTLIEKIIASGSKKIQVGEETAIISFFVGEKIALKESLNLNVKNLKKKITERYKIKGLIREESDYIFTDKSLDNFFFIGLIREIFPNAKIINCRRNALSSIVSILKNNLGDVTWAHDVNHIFEFFDIYYKKIEDFKKIHPNFIYDLQIEEFVSNPEKESKNLMKFCELQWNKKCLEFYKRKDLTSRTASNIQIRKAIYKHSKNKYLPYKQFLNVYGEKYYWFK